MLSSIPNNISHTPNNYSSAHQKKHLDKQNGFQKEEIDPAQSPAEQPGLESSLEDRQKVQQLKAIDQEVKTHEQTHLSAAGGLATGGASFSYQKGPDGVNYAVGGEVNIDTAAIPGDATATLQKAETIRRAALAPANPSSQDRKVASQASAMANKAKAEIFQENQHASENGEGHDNHDKSKISFSV